MTLRGAVLGLRIAAMIPYVWLRTRLLPLPRALAGLTPDAAARSVRRLKPRQRRHEVRLRGLRTSVGEGRLRAVPAAVSTDGNPASDDCERIILLTDLLLERRVALLRPSCMLRSLVLYRFLREAGIPVQVNFGVARDGDALKGHSWLTLDGLPYAEPVDPTPRFRVVYRYPKDSSQLAARSS
jgi:Transglutaminase-like superfamily